MGVRVAGDAFGPAPRITTPRNTLTTMHYRIRCGSRGATPRGQHEPALTVIRLDGVTDDRAASGALVPSLWLALLRWRGRSSLLGWRRCSDGKGEFGEDRFDPAAGLGIEAELVVSTAQVLNERMPATDNFGGADAFQAAHRSRSGLQPAVICFNRVVGVLLHDVPRRGHELVKHPRVPGRWSPRSAVEPRQVPGRRTGG